MSPTVLLVVYCLLIIAASVGGGLIPLLVRLTHTRLQLAISLTAGFMFGVAVLHMVPHAIETPGVTASGAMIWVLVGFLFMFFIERFFSFHTHEVAELDDGGKVLTSAEDLPEHDHNEHARHHDHAHPHGMVGETPGNKLSWTGAAIGMTLHSVIAGVALASAVASESSGAGHHATAALAGLAVFLVVVLHKPLDALTVITLTASAGFAKPTRHLINGLFALAVPLGVGLFGLGLNQTALAESGTLIGHALAFSAGTFLCIALSDLLPELHFHSHDRGKLSTALLVGVTLAFVMATAEHSMHDHDDGHGHGHGNHSHSTPPAVPHDHGGHAGHDHGELADPHAGHDHGEASTPHAGHRHDKTVDPHAGHNH
ncbi:MAG: ZIP family metal transporter [Planctomycetota bacterium]